MNNSIKKISNFLKINLRKNPKKFVLIFSLFLFFPSLFVFAGLGDMVYSGFLSVIIFITGVFKDLSSYLVYITGVIFDNLLTISIYTNLYNADWVKLGWAIIRDVANIAFIFGIIIIGIFMIIGRTQWKTMLGHLIIIAFVMNFSMFFARVIIDAGNFTTAIFYTMSSVKTGKEAEKRGDATKDDLKVEGLVDRWIVSKAVLGKNKDWEPYFGNRSIASALIFFVNPDHIYSEKAFKEKIKDKNLEDIYIKKSLIILNIVFIITMVMMSIALLKGSFNFVSRTIHLIKLIITAPAYFALYFLPGGGQHLYKWAGDISGKAFCMTSYLLGIWVLLAFLSSETMNTILNGVADDTILKLITILFIKTYIVYKALNMLTEYSSKQCENGDLGKGIVGTFGKVASFASGFGVAKLAAKTFTGTTARGALGVGSRVTGRIGKALYNPKGWGANTWGIKHIKDYGAKLAHRGEDSLYEKKIFGQSFSEEVERARKEDESLKARLSKEERTLKRSQDISTNFNKDKKDTDGNIKHFKPFKDEKMNEAYKNLAALTPEDIKDIEKDLEKDKKYQELSDGDKQKYKKNKWNEKRSVKKAEYLTNNVGYLNEKSIKNSVMNSLLSHGSGAAVGAAIGGVVAGPIGAAAGAAIGGAGAKLPFYENIEANRQLAEKEKIISRSKGERKDYDLDKKEEFKKYQEKKQEVEIKRDKDMHPVKEFVKTQGTLIDIKNLITKGNKMWDKDHNGQLDLSQILKKNGSVDINPLIEQLKTDNRIAPEIQKIANKIEGVSEYNKAMNTINVLTDEIEGQRLSLKEALKKGDEKQAGLLEKQIKLTNDQIKDIQNSSNVKRITKVFKEMAEVGMSEIKAKANKEIESVREDYEGAKKKIDSKIEANKQQEKEGLEDIAAGRENRHPTKDNIPRSVNTESVDS